MYISNCSLIVGCVPLGMAWYECDLKSKSLKCNVSANVLMKNEFISG